MGTVEFYYDKSFKPLFNQKRAHKLYLAVMEKGRQEFMFKYGMPFTL